MVQKTLDQKLARIHADPHGAKDFILADAKDADMALAIGAPGRSPEAHPGEVRASCPMVSTPIFCSRALVAGPTPHISSTGRS